LVPICRKLSSSGLRVACSPHSSGFRVLRLIPICRKLPSSGLRVWHAHPTLPDLGFRVFMGTYINIAPEYGIFWVFMGERTRQEPVL
jgi:hypothetical protein